MITFQNLGNMGRLGNQLFQICVVIGYARKYNQKIEFPNWIYKDYFNFNFDSLISQINTVIQESDSLNYSEIPCYMPQMGNINFNGYFQSERNFIHVKKEILDIFKTEETDRNIGFIHLRRGDYLQKQDFHCPLSLQYYIDGMDKLGFKNYLCFSDDITWCKEFFKDPRLVFVEGTNEIEDLKMMSKCKGAVIANSSFSWWGAWLGDHKNVIIPRNWFGPSAGNYRIEDRLCEGWEII